MTLKGMSDTSMNFTLRHPEITMIYIRSFKVMYTYITDVTYYMNAGTRHGTREKCKDVHFRIAMLILLIHGPQ